MYNSVSCRTSIIKDSNIQQTEDYTWRQLPHFRRAPSSRLAILRITKSFLWIDWISLIKFWRIRCKPKRLFLTYNVLGCIVPHSCSPSFANLAESWNGSLAKKWFCWDISYWYGDLDISYLYGELTLISFCISRANRDLPLRGVFFSPGEVTRERASWSRLTVSLKKHT